MGRPPRNSQGGYVYHVIARGMKPKPMFRSVDDYQEFDTVLVQAVDRFEPRLLAYCVLPKHWHLILTPRKDGDLSKLMAWLTTTHSARWHTKPQRAGTGGLYKRRFLAFPVQDDLKLLDVLCFVESHPLRSGLVKSLSDWQWSSGWRRDNEKGHGNEKDRLIASCPRERRNANQTDKWSRAHHASTGDGEEGGVVVQLGPGRSSIQTSMECLAVELKCSQRTRFENAAGVRVRNRLSPPRRPFA